jgi:hypothetical protein
VSAAAPKVFVSHASEDKPVVVPLATRLRADGVEALLDKWEIRIGDSLVDKIFSGIDGCDVFLIVLSRISVQKPWVREELNAGFVTMLAKKTRLMAVRIDDCEVPLVLKSRRWLNLDPRGDYETEYRELLTAIFDKHDRPPLGKPAAYLQTQAPGYSVDETAIWDHFIKLVAELGPVHVGATQIHEALPHIPLETISDTVRALDHVGIVRAQFYGDGVNFLAELSPSAWHDRASEVLGVDVVQDERIALASLVSDGDCQDGEELARRTGLEPVRLMMALLVLRDCGDIDFLEVTGHGLASFIALRATLDGRRRLRQA